MRRSFLAAALALLAAFPASGATAQTHFERPHNVVLFVADGLRARMVDDTPAPTFAAIAREGVSLRNSHALFPTFTTANASAMATGHMLGDTGDFSNVIYAGFAVANARGSATPFLESDPILADVDEHFAGNYLDEATILKLARDKGYSTAAQQARQRPDRGRQDQSQDRGGRERRFGFDLPAGQRPRSRQAGDRRASFEVLASLEVWFDTTGAPKRISL